MGYLRVRFLSKRFRSFDPNYVIIIIFFFVLLSLMMDFNFLNMFCSSAIFVDKRRVAPRLSLSNIAALNYLLRFEIFVSEDRQLRAVHLILDFESISELYQEIGHAIRAGDPRLARIEVSIPNFLAREDLPPIVLPLQWVLPEAAATPREEISSSCSTLEVEIDKFRFEEKEIQRAQIVHISDVEDKPDRYSSVHASILVIACPDSTSEEEEDDMSLNRGNKGLRDLWPQGKKCQLQKKFLSPKFLPFFLLLPLYPLLTLDCTLFQI